MDIIKIKVNLPKKVYDILEVDMEAFNFIKPNGEKNKNGFINCLIKNYFRLFALREEEVIKKIKSQTSIKDEDIPAIANIFFEERYKKEQNFSKDLQFILQKENLEIYDEIIEVFLANRSISQYFREMIILYTSYPMDKRESILFRNSIDKVKKAITQKRKAILSLDDGTKKVTDLYGVFGTGEQIFNYVIGVQLNDNKREVFTYRLNKVKNLIILPDQPLEITEEEKEKLELMIYQGPIFPINEIVDVAVEFDSYGLTLFRLFIHDRPKPYKVEGNVYHFKSSLTHLAIYFYKFGTTAKILSPDNVRKIIGEQFQNAADLYK